jgi:uncharacterized alpha-E superfamily protein
MLSRVAESLYWMARYIERAEDLSRFLSVTFIANLDARSAGAQVGWRSLVGIAGDEKVFNEKYGEANAASVIEFLVWGAENPNSVQACVANARENARSIREQISSEMWEGINRLYFLTRDASHDAVLRNPTDFFRQTRDRAHGFQGITSATMTHSEPYQFIQLGLHLERADKTARILGVNYLPLMDNTNSPAETSLQLITLLRLCSAFEPYRRTVAGQMTSESVVEYLLLNREFPRAVLFCLNACISRLGRIGEDPANSSRVESPRRVLGRLEADLEYLDIHDVLGENMGPFLHSFLIRLNTVGGDIARTYFNTNIILPDERPRQQQQQQ